jgi:hypothetical protein
MVAGNRLLKSRVFDKAGGLKGSTERWQRYLPTVPTSKCCCAKQIGFSMSQKVKDKLAAVRARSVCATVLKTDRWRIMEIVRLNPTRVTGARPTHLVILTIIANRRQLRSLLESFPAAGCPLRSMSCCTN